MLGQPQPYLINLRNLTNEDIDLVGKEAVQNSFLHRQNIPTPPAFVVTSRAFDDFLTAAQLVEPIMELISQIDLSNYKEKSYTIQKLITDTKIPTIIERPIVEAYKNLSSGTLPFVSLEISNILPIEFVPKSNHHHFALNIYGTSEFLTALKQSWAELFNSNAIFERINQGYEGILTTSVIVQKMIRPEVSGEVYTQKEDASKFMYVSAMYGFEDVNATSTTPKDIYKVDLESFTLAERTLIQQTEMLVRKGKVKPGESANMSVKISSEWQSAQKLDDERVVKLVELTQKINEVLKTQVELSWGIEACEINIFSIHEVLQDKKPTKPNPKKESEIQKDNLPQKQESKEESKDITNTLKEVAEVVAKAEILEHLEEIKAPEAVISPTDLALEALPPLATSQEVRQELALEPKQESNLEETKINLLTQLFVNAGSMMSEALAEVIKWQKAYISGNDLILNNQVLPEQVTSQKDILSYISNFSLQINNVARLVDGGELIYSLSSIDPYILKLLSISENEVGKFYDERLIANEQALLIEISAIKKSRNESKHKNISIIIPGLRSYTNLLKIKRVISGEGLRRSPSLKIYAEVSIPSFVYELNQIDSDDIDGIVVDIDSLIKTSFLKQDIKEPDYFAVLNILKQIKDISKQKKLSLSFKLDTKPSSKFFKELVLMQPTAIINSYKLDESDIKLIEDTEKEFFEKMLIPLNKRGRKIKKLF